METTYISTPHPPPGSGCHSPDRSSINPDQVNDIDKFRMADEPYAVTSAVPEFAEHAIGSNDDDAVALWLKARR